MREAQRLLAEEAEPQPSEEEDRRRAALAVELVTLHPSLRVQPFDDGFSYGCVLETGDPACPIPYVDVGLGRGTVSFSYSSDPKAAFREAFRVIAIFERHGYTAYDPQTQSVLSSSGSAQLGESSFLATRDTVMRQMRERGETVLGFPEQKRTAPELLVWLVLVVVVTTAVLLIRYHYIEERPPEMTQRLREAQEHLRGGRQTPPNTTVETDARKSSARGSP